MSVIITSQTALGNGAWRLEWSSDQPNPTFYIWRGGVLAQTTPATSAVFRADAGAQLVIDITDTPDPPAAAFPGTMKIEWTTQGPSVAAYRVEELIGATWTARQTLNNRGQWLFQFESRYLEDSQSHQFRVVPVGVNGNDGTPTLMTGFMVRHPDAPTPIYTLNPDDTVTIQ